MQGAFGGQRERCGFARSIDARAALRIFVHQDHRASSGSGLCPRSPVGLSEPIAGIVRPHQTLSKELICSAKILNCYCHPGRAGETPLLLRTPVSQWVTVCLVSKAHFLVGHRWILSFGWTSQLKTNQNPPVTFQTYTTSGDTTLDGVAANVEVDDERIDMRPT